MKRPRGIAIPGLAMAASELPTIEGLIRLENPEIGSGVQLDSRYTLEDLAALHLGSILGAGLDDDPVLCGMSMGALILSVLATDLRPKLPARCRFRFIAPSPNSASNPAVSEGRLEEWSAVHSGDIPSFTRVLEPFFSKGFRREHPERFERYVRYRAFGENNQSLKAFRRQTIALRDFEAEKYYSRVDSSEAEFIRGAEDIIFGLSHREELSRLAPAVRWHEIPVAGHMLNFEHPEVFGVQPEPQ